MENTTTKRYKMKFEYEVKTLWTSLMIVASSNFFALAFVTYSGFRADVVMVWAIMNIIWIPASVFAYSPRFLRYRKLSKDISVTIDREERRILVRARDRKKVYSFEDVKSITRWAEDVVERRKKQKPRWGDFFYYVIYLKSGEEIIITSLMTYDGELEIGDKKSDLNPWDNAQITIKGEKIVNLELKRGIA